MKYRKKPVEIEAIQFTGDNEFEIADFMRIPVSELQTSVDAIYRADGDYRENKHIRIDTLEGTMTADYGDWIIKGVKGEFYPCKPDIFKATYEVAESFMATTDARDRAMRVTDIQFNPPARSAVICVENYYGVIRRGDTLYMFTERDISDINRSLLDLWGKIRELEKANKNLARYKQCLKDMKGLMEEE